MSRDRFGSVGEDAARVAEAVAHAAGQHGVSQGLAGLSVVTGAREFLQAHGELKAALAGGSGFEQVQAATRMGVAVASAAAGAAVVTAAVVGGGHVPLVVGGVALGVQAAASFAHTWAVARDFAAAEGGAGSCASASSPPSVSASSAGSVSSPPSPSVSASSAGCVSSPPSPSASASSVASVSPPPSPSVSASAAAPASSLASPSASAPASPPLSSPPPGLGLGR